MFFVFNLLIILLFVGTTIWMNYSSNWDSNIIFKAVIGLLLIWFLVVGAVYCVHDLFSTIYHFCFS
jgi:hypothetical protein